MARLLLFLLLTACSQPPPLTRLSGTAMTIDWRVQVGEPEASKKVDTGEIEAAVAEVFREIDAIYNRWNPESEISGINRAPAHLPLPLSTPLAEFLKRTEELVVLTEGRFDPTIEPLQALWKAHLAQGTLPSEKRIKTVLPAVGWDKVQISPPFLQKEHPLTAFDLGGIAKGYAVDLITERLVGLGYPNVYVEWGGEIRAAGKHPAKRAWTIYIAKPSESDPSQAIAIVPLQDRAIATSGDYLQYWRLADESGATLTYFHIFDKKTGAPLQKRPRSLTSVSVAASSCLKADALATALMLFPSAEEAEVWAQKLQEEDPALEFWLITESQ